MSVSSDDPFVTFAKFLDIVDRLLAKSFLKLSHIGVFLVTHTICVDEGSCLSDASFLKYFFLLVGSSTEFLCVTKCYATNH